MQFVELCTVIIPNVVNNVKSKRKFTQGDDEVTTITSGIGKSMNKTTFLRLSSVGADDFNLSVAFLVTYPSSLLSLKISGLVRQSRQAWWQSSGKADHLMNPGTLQLRQRVRDVCLPGKLRLTVHYISSDAANLFNNHEENTSTTQ